MERRNFLQLAALALAGKAAQRVWPFRVYSIPKEIVAPKFDLFRELLHYQSARAIEMSTNGSGIYLRPGDTVGIYNGPADYLRGTARVERIQDGAITLDHVPAGIIPGDVLISGAQSRHTIHDIGAHAHLPYLGVSDRRTGVFLNLLKSS